MRRGWWAIVVFLAAGAAGAQTPRPDGRIRVELVGDSTQTDNAGYGRGFCANLSSAVDCINMAKGGASTKTYRAEGLWEKALATRPDYMLIQFGHNDEVSPAHLEREVPLQQYQENLRGFVTEARAQGVRPLLVTPLARRYFGADGKIHSDLTAYSDAMKAVASQAKVPLIDLQDESIAYLDQVGETAGMKLGITKKDAAGKTIPDKTHLNWEGSYVFGRMVAVDLGRVEPQLARDVLPQPAELPAEGRLAMRVIRGAPFKIVLVGDSTVATEGGWGPGFCATLTPNVTCVDDALNGRSTKSYIDEGAWKKALAEKGQYYFIQFGHNDQKPDPKRHTDPDTTYSDNLRMFIREVRAEGGIPILVTPLSRRNYRDGQLIMEDGLGDYAAAMRRVAEEEHVPVVDLYSLSTKYLSGMTQAEADRFDMIDHPDAKAEGAGAGKPDRTHLDAEGKAVFGRMVADAVIRSEVELGPNVVGSPAGASPALPAPANRR
ncbi:MAG: rhamnogalacturonan acetylesterase [Acidobacteriaceae bacterium]